MTANTISAFTKPPTSNTCPPDRDRPALGATTQEHVDQRFDERVAERRDERGEGDAERDRHCKIHEVAPLDELLEAAQ
ncbi:MAG: hypothetical protein L0Y54_20995 [Sporichthyaceae bacterium]|nr:hypothetical protein [Sporichthyaceae bacterium]